MVAKRSNMPCYVARAATLFMLLNIFFWHVEFQRKCASTVLRSLLARFSSDLTCHFPLTELWEQIIAFRELAIHVSMKPYRQLSSHELPSARPCLCVDLHNLLYSAWCIDASDRGEAKQGPQSRAKALYCNLPDTSGNVATQVFWSGCVAWRQEQIASITAALRKWCSDTTSEWRLLTCGRSSYVSVQQVLGNAALVHATLKQQAVLAALAASKHASVPAYAT